MSSSHWTPQQLADEAGVSASIVRRWLRGTMDRAGESGPWLIGDDLATQARGHFAATASAREARPAECSVDSCDRNDLKGRGLCPLHYNRWYRHGSTEKRDGSEYQRAKTHCPHGHEYTERNTIIYASDGRRRCRACRRKTRGESQL